MAAIAGNGMPAMSQSITEPTPHTTLNHASNPVVTLALGVGASSTLWIEVDMIGLLDSVEKNSAQESSAEASREDDRDSQADTQKSAVTQRVFQSMAVKPAPFAFGLHAMPLLDWI